MNVHEKLYDLVAEFEEKIETMPDGEEKDKKIENFEKLYKLLLEKETLDETVQDRRDKMEMDNENEQAKIKNEEKRRLHEIKELILGFVGILSFQTITIVLSNCGIFVEKLPGLVTKLLLRKA